MEFDKKNRVAGITRRDIFALLSYGKDEEVFDTTKSELMREQRHYYTDESNAQIAIGLLK